MEWPCQNVKILSKFEKRFKHLIQFLKAFKIRKILTPAFQNFKDFKDFRNFKRPCKFLQGLLNFEKAFEIFERALKLLKVTYFGEKRGPFKFEKPLKILKNP